MAPQRPAKITGFFQPFPRRAADDFDGDEIVVTRKTPSTQAGGSNVVNGQPKQAGGHRDAPTSRGSTPMTTIVPQAKKLSNKLPASSRERSATPHRDTPPSGGTQKSPLSVRTSKPFTSVPPPSTADDDHKPVTSSFSSNGSKRITVNGMNAVTNSDEDDSDDLEDFTAFLPRKRLRLTPEAPAKSNSVPRSMYKSILAVKPVKPARYSMSDLIKRKEEEDSLDARIRKLEDEEAREEMSKADAVDLLADEGDKSRVMAAVDRAELLDEAEAFYLFKSAEPVCKQKPFSDSDLALPMKTQLDRELLLRSGFLQDYAGVKTLPPDLVKWYQSEVHACRGAGRQATKLVAASQHKISPAGLRDLYKLRKGDESPCKQLPPGLKDNLRLMAMSPGSIVEEKPETISDLALLNLDNNIRQSVDLQQSIEDTLHALLSSKSGSLEQSVTKAIKLILDDELLSQQQTAQAIASLPASSPQLHLFRRRLALQYLLDTDNIDPAMLYDLETGNHILKKLRKDQAYQVSADTDWWHFYWLVHLLDIAIDAGFSDHNFSKDERNAFDEQVDKLAQRLRLIANSIRDSATSHLQRTEAKASLERLILRLEYAVRTTPKPRKSIFGGLVAQSNLMSFLQ